MGIEIERKFLVVGDGWRGQGVVTSIRQGYLSTDPERVVRVRVTGERGFLTVKGRPQGARRIETELDVPLPEALELLALCKGALVEKRRHLIDHGGFRWELDEFVGANTGLLVAELEVGDEGDFERALSVRPAWVGRDVTEDLRLANSALAERPFGSWPAAEQRSLG